jgi:hypothetical protein
MLINEKIGTKLILNFRTVSRSNFQEVSPVRANVRKTILGLENGIHAILLWPAPQEDRLSVFKGKFILAVQGHKETDHQYPNLFKGVPGCPAVDPHV